MNLTSNFFVQLPISFSRFTENLLVINIFPGKIPVFLNFVVIIPFAKSFIERSNFSSKKYLVSQNKIQISCIQELQTEEIVIIIK